MTARVTAVPEGFSQYGGFEVRYLRHDPVPLVVMEGRVPSPAECREIERLGFGLHLLELPAPTRDLRVLERFARLEHLSVTGVGYDLRPVAALSSLVTLSLNVADAAPVDLSGLDRLEVFDGFYGPSASVLEAPALRAASFQEVKHGPPLPAIPDGLRELALTDLQGTRSIAPAGTDPALERLDLNGIRTFDAACLEQFPQLRVVTFSRATTLTGVDALTRLTGLRELGFQSCRSIDPGASLLDLPEGVVVGVGGRPPFDEALIAEFGRAPADWQFSR